MRIGRSSDQRTDPFARRLSVPEPALIFSEIILRAIISTPFAARRGRWLGCIIRGGLARRPGVLGKGLRKGLLEQGFIARAPELMGGADGLRSGIFTDAIGVRGTF